MKEYELVPPLTETEAAPFDPPLQDTLVCDAADATKADGSVILNVAVDVHEFASVTVQVHVPTVKPLTLIVPSPVGFPGVQLYVYPPAPPVAAFTDAAPSEPLLQEILVCEAVVNTITEGAVILNVAVAVQEFASVTVHVQVPAVSPLTETVPSPVGFPGAQSYVYGLVPPVAAFTVAVPSEPPLQEILVCDAGVSEGPLAVATVTLRVIWQEFASVIVQV